MARVVLPGTLKQYTGGVTELVLDAATIRQLFRVLGEKFPEIAPHLADGMAVAIDGQIYQDALLQPIPNNSEVHIIPKIAGGLEATILLSSAIGTSLTFPLHKEKVNV